MAATVNLELDPIFLKALGFLHSKSKDSAEKLRALLDESLSRGIDSSYRPSPKLDSKHVYSEEVDQPKVSIAKPVSVKQEPKASSGLPTGGNNGKPITAEKVKKEVEKRSDKIKLEISEGVDIPKKPRLEKPEARSSPITVQTSKDLALTDLSSFEETSADDFAMEMGLACVVCRQMTVTSGNQLVECQECHNLYHQDCHKPQVTDKEVNDPRLVWYCARCTRQMKKMAQKTQKPSQKPGPAVVSVAPAVKDPLIKKPDIKLKLETTSAFLAFKRTEVKTSATVSGNSASTSVSSSSTSGLTGWAAFAAKTSSAGPSTAKMGSTTQSTSSKPAAASSSQKSVGLSGLATAKAGLGSKIASPSNSTSPVQLKTLPPLPLGKTSLSRSVSSDNVSKAGLPSPGGSAPGSSQSAGGNGSGGTTGSSGSSTSKSSAESGNQSPSLKGPTSQESQLNAMKRLQMVKKKAAQKKLKK
ncbi:integrator complex subunit 12 isoform X1 [Varanus komodoensis]|uniref:Integrator complex subunit 12 n=1 Tax=Varanus komodoensis TaxID=61221 RepID=A0A8D2Q0Z8_VARKO|nr:integrator complex subunit 12 isoform X1 [Varanus komodoensis]XP_044284312.1 integrator complex subunit 12 isoform X1 [Varanus komodoensis]XP_044284313.1 integrator complex subunit 12 isoform X1 [Varanus komodoensis]XP_044284314.1 integrator complex subunit 12 isoform X1 [Varanus komodoensis]XP_044284315.1 integrator complex subunit 12 isoform X1 [Varanus komodoensis]XP_044284316.1 integrator complex subunit 12 isoform X1 [Varanus komodoensis]